MQPRMHTYDGELLALTLAITMQADTVWLSIADIMRVLKCTRQKVIELLNNEGILVNKNDGDNATKRVPAVKVAAALLNNSHNRAVIERNVR